VSAADIAASKKFRNPVRRNLKDRKNRVAQKKVWRFNKLRAATGADDDDEEEESDDE
jgi:hypothetical protein